MKVLLLGSNGQLGTEIKTFAHTHDLLTLTHKQCDIATMSATDFTDLFTQQHIDIVINTAAFTAVDRAETHISEAYAVNAYAVATLAEACQQSNVRLIHVSTDYVFNGSSSHPYSPDTKPDPINIYGASKALGEALLFQHCPSAVCLRTSWLYSTHGNNFIKTVLPLMRSSKTLTVVNDQLGSPTWAANVAAVIWRFVDETHLKGIWHWTDAGVCSWFEFATELQKKALEKRLLLKPVTVMPISSFDYGAAAKRPQQSALDCQKSVIALGLTQQPWQKALDNMLDKL